MEQVKPRTQANVIQHHYSEKRLKFKECRQEHYAYFRNKKIMGSKRISRKTKLKAYKTATHPPVICASGTMCRKNKDVETKKLFDRKIIRNIFGSKKIINEQVRRLMHADIHNTLEGKYILKVIKSRIISLYV